MARLSRRIIGKASSEGTLRIMLPASLSKASTTRNCFAKDSTVQAKSMMATASKHPLTANHCIVAWLLLA